MELRVLRYFLMVAREENITRAAALLNVTQPTLSRQLIQLEEELGVKLFERGVHSITLTEEGMLLRERAQEMIALCDKTIGDLSLWGQSISGQIAIGSGETRGLGYVSALMRRFQEEHPQVRYALFSGIADEIKEKLERGILDIGILTEPVDITKYEFVRLPIKEKWAFLTRSDSPLAEREYVTAEDVAAVPLIMVKRELMRSELASWFGDNFATLDIRATCDLLFNYSTLVRSGIGSALILETGAIYSDLVAVPIKPPLESGLVVVWKRGQMMTEAGSRFISFLRSSIGKEYN